MHQQRALTVPLAVEKKIARGDGGSIFMLAPRRGCDSEGGAHPRPEKISGGGSRDAVLLYFEVGFSVFKAL